MVFLQMLPQLFPTDPRDIEDILTIYGFEKRMEEIVNRAEHYFLSVEQLEAYLPEIVDSLKKFGLGRLASRFVRS